MSATEIFTVADHCQLFRWRIADAPASRLRSGWPVERLLDAAGDGVLLGSDTADPDDPDEGSLSIDNREVTEDESRALVDLLVDGYLVWIGIRIALTAHGRELLVRYQHIGGEQR